MVVLVGYPKTGNNWLKYMINKYNDENSSTTHPIGRLYKWTHDDGAIFFDVKKDNSKIFRDDDRSSYKKDDVLLSIRDPRDVMVSYFYHIKYRKSTFFKYKNIANFIRHEEDGFKRVLRFYDIWRKNIDVPNRVLITSYEDRINKGVDEFRRIIEFMNLKLDEEKLNRVFEESRFEHMRRRESQGKITGLKKHQHIDGMLIRKGTVGQYKEEMSKEDIEYCNNLMKDIKPIYNYYF